MHLPLIMNEPEKSEEEVNEERGRRTHERKKRASAEEKVRKKGERRKKQERYSELTLQPEVAGQGRAVKGKGEGDLPQ